MRTTLGRPPSFKHSLTTSHTGTDDSPLSYRYHWSRRCSSSPFLQSILVLPHPNPPLLAQHGKSQTVKAISGVHTVRFKNELERNITIKLGYANAKIYQCENPACERPGSFRSYSSDKEDHPPCEVPGCGGTMKLLRFVSLLFPFLFSLID